MPEGRGLKTKDRGQMAEDRWQMADGRRPKSEVRCLKAEDGDGRQMAEEREEAIIY